MVRSFFFVGLGYSFQLIPDPISFKIGFLMISGDSCIDVSVLLNLNLVHQTTIKTSRNCLELEEIEIEVKIEVKKSKKKKKKKSKKQTNKKKKKKRYPKRFIITSHQIKKDITQPSKKQKQKQKAKNKKQNKQNKQKQTKEKLIMIRLNKEIAPKSKRKRKRGKRKRKKKKRKEENKKRKKENKKRNREREKINNTLFQNQKEKKIDCQIRLLPKSNC